MGNISKLTLSLALLFSPGVFAETSLSQAFHCYKSVSDITRLGPHLLEGSIVALGGARTGERGFYLYTTKTIHFCETPSKPHRQSKERDEYRLRLEGLGREPLYLDYLISRSTERVPLEPVKCCGVRSAERIVDRLEFFTEIADVPSRKSDKVESVVCRAKMTDETKALLVQQAKADLRYVTAKFLQLRHAVLSKRGPRDYIYTGRSDIESALMPCSGISELRDAVAEELKQIPEYAQREQDIERYENERKSKASKISH